VHIWRGIIETGQARGVFTAGDSRLRAFLMIGALNWMYAWYDRDSHDVDQLVATFIDGWCHGIFTPS